MIPQTFAPAWTGQVLSATNVSQSATLVNTLSNAVRVYNSTGSADEVCISITSGNGTATTSCLRLAPGMSETFSKNGDTINYICPTSTATVQVNTGEGM